MARLFTPTPEPEEPTESLVEVFPETPFYKWFAKTWGPTSYIGSRGYANGITEQQMKDWRYGFEEGYKAYRAEVISLLAVEHDEVECDQDGPG